MDMDENKFKIDCFWKGLSFFENHVSTKCLSFAQHFYWNIFFLIDTGKKFDNYLQFYNFKPDDWPSVLYMYIVHVQVYKTTVHSVLYILYEENGSLSIQTIILIVYKKITHVASVLV